MKIDFPDHKLAFVHCWALPANLMMAGILEEYLSVSWQWHIRGFLLPPHCLMKAAVLGAGPLWLIAVVQEAGPHWLTVAVRWAGPHWLKKAALEAGSPCIG